MSFNKKDTDNKPKRYYFVYMYDAYPWDDNNKSRRPIHTVSSKVIAPPKYNLLIQKEFDQFCTSTITQLESDNSIDIQNFVVLNLMPFIA